MESFKQKNLIIVSALGYFVDVYDLLLFGVIKSPSLSELGIKTDQLNVGISLTNYQVLGLVLGGIVWGMMGDKRGRLSVLLWSIGIYSAANLFNAFIDSLVLYKICRFLAGFGLAGELGAGIALVMEHSTTKKNFGPQIITGFGLLGAVFAGVVGELLNWRVAYGIGGLMGFLLLFLRSGLRDSTIYTNLSKSVVKGNFLEFFTNFHRFKKYLLSILIGLPVYFVIALLIQSAKELGAQNNLVTTSGLATIVCYAAFSSADYYFTYLSNTIESRKRVFITLHVASLVMLFIFVYAPVPNLFVFYLKYALFGITIGYWGLLTVNAAEQFSTRIRALACTTIPNFIRGSFFFIGVAFTLLKSSLGLNQTILIVGVVLIVIALISSIAMKDGFKHSLENMED